MGCKLCNRDKKLTFHHLIPKKVHNKNYIKNKLDIQVDVNEYGIEICTDCHSFIHRKIDHLNLALSYNTIEKLKSHPEVNSFIEWVSKQDKKVKKK